ncbi:MAG: C40 family peptidase [Chitinophagaceae bacterium]|nr:C40 family peptidase [Chitinophagaceae bacterium]
MIFLTCCVPVAPMRLEAGHRVEMISQLLFGECAVLLDKQPGGWIKVKSKSDEYTGWCQQAHLQEISVDSYNLDKYSLTADWAADLIYNKYTMKIPMGSILTGMDSGKFKGNLWDPFSAIKNEENIKQLAFKFLNTAYLWGGRSVFGVDCSGFTQSVYKFLNIPLLRDASQQATQGELIDFLQQAKCGDLAFFDDDDGSITHVGLLLNDHEIIHAAGKVRVDKIDSQGIINADTGLRTQKLRIIKRYF